MAYIKETPTGLFWSEQGEIACANHIPYVGSDTWIHDAWEPLPTGAAAALARAGAAPACEVCGKEPE